MDEDEKAELIRLRSIVKYVRYWHPTIIEAAERDVTADGLPEGEVADAQG